MRRSISVFLGAFLALSTVGVVASASVGVAPAGATIQASKSAFCGANESIDRAGANVTSEAGFLAVLKKHQKDLAILKKDAPSGSLGQTVQATVSAAEEAISSNNANALNSVPSSGAIDTYCGVNGNGQPLPTYFGKGKSTAFCSTFLPIFQAVSSASSPSAALAALTSNQTQISQLDSDLSSLPSSIKAKATATVKQAQTAISTKNAASVRSGGSNSPANFVALYCGQNQ